VLNPLQYPELSPAFGKLVLIDAKKAIAKSFTQEQRRKYFLFDEINVYASPILIDLVNKSRSAGVTALLATQSMADLEAAAGPAFKQQIIENCNNYIIMRQNSPEGAEELAGVLGTKTGMEITHQIGDGGEGTGRGSVKQVREFLYHPDTIKNLRTGEAIFLSKDNMLHQKIKIRKPL
jgi:type IV secretory pathway TraG/TraD family ATPase VirD4